ncbi:MAG: hypothetical protein GX090_06980 [Firmicutes bacterium]|nr:hypothetical protein [Bacillota bacterium]
MKSSTTMPTRLMLFLAAAAVLAAAACSPAPSAPAAEYWVVAGTNRGESFARNCLAGYDGDGRLAVHCPLPQYYIASALLDAENRIWLGVAWNDYESANEILLWQNNSWQTITVGKRPEAGFAVFQDKLVAGCAEAGVGFSLWQVDRDSLSAREFFTADKGDRDFLLLTAVAANDQYLVAAALHDDPMGELDSSNTSIWWFDADFQPAGSLYLGPNTAVWSIVPLEDGRFMLLNNGAHLDGSAALLIFDPVQGAVTERRREGAGFPYKGAAGDGKICILNRIWSSTRIDDRRSLTVIAGGKAETIALPDGMGFVDVAVRGDKVYLAAWQRGANADDGVYELDLTTGELRQIIAHYDASAILLPK